MHFKPCHLVTLCSHFGLTMQGKNLVWPNVLNHTYFKSTEWKAKIISINFVLKFRTALPWLQSDRCQKRAEYLINAEINTQNLLSGMPNSVYLSMHTTIYRPTDGCSQRCTSTNMFNFHFSYSRQFPFPPLFTLTTTKMA